MLALPVFDRTQVLGLPVFDRTQVLGAVMTVSVPKGVMGAIRAAQAKGSPLVVAQETSSSFEGDTGVQFSTPAWHFRNPLIVAGLGVAAGAAIGFFLGRR